MALESQGIVLRIADGTIATAASTALIFNATGIASTLASGSLNFTSHFSSGMRIKTNSTASTNIYTVDAVAATALSLYEGATADTAVSQVNGYTMNAIGEVISFSGPSGSPAVIDITHLGSTAKEKMISVRDEGQVTFEILYDSSGNTAHTQLNSERIARTKRYYEIELTDGTNAGTFLFFAAYVSGFSLSGAVDDALKASVTLDITDEVHWTKTTR